jgi:hypothetical protein
MQERSRRGVFFSNFGIEWGESRIETISMMGFQVL